MNSLSYRVLIVEDQPLQREYWLHQLREQGFVQLSWAEDGLQALFILQQPALEQLLRELSAAPLNGQALQRWALQQPQPHVVVMRRSTQQVLISVSLVALALGLSVSGPGTPATAQQALPPKHQYQHLALTKSATELRQAIDNGQLTAWFQPKKSLQHNRIVAAEALLRWIKPSGEVLLPGAFLSVLEQAGLDEPLLVSITRQSLRAQQQWQREQGLLVAISINLPTHLLDDPVLPERLQQLVLELRGDPETICFELTETSTVRDPELYYAATNRLRDMGFGLAQDDFGQGYSSLYQLLSTPFSELKIDRTLLQGSNSDEGKALALQKLIELGHQLGMNVIVEGVETHAELDLLSRLGCDYIQGFLIGEALNTQDFAQYLFSATPFHIGAGANAATN